MELLTPDFGFIFWHAILFLVTMVLLARYAWKPVLALIKQREEAYATAMRQMEEAHKELAAHEEKKAALLAEAEAERTRIVAEATQEKAHLIKAAEKEARQAQEKVALKVRKQLATEQEEARQALRQEAVSLVVHTTQHLLHQELSSAAKQPQFIKQMMEKVEQANTTS